MSTAWFPSGNRQVALAEKEVHKVPKNIPLVILGIRENSEYNGAEGSHSAREKGIEPDCKWTGYAV